VKAYVVLGDSQVELGKFGVDLKMIDKGIECLRRGLSLCTGANLRRFEPEI